MTLHQAIQLVLKKAQKPMSASDVAFQLNKTKLYTKKDGSVIASSQVSARVNKYPSLFNKQNGVISLSKNIVVANSSKRRVTNIKNSKPIPVKEKQQVATKNIVARLLDLKQFKYASSIDSIVPDGAGLYCISIINTSALPSPFKEELKNRAHNILYVGIATKSLHKRMLNQELRAKGHGTFFRSLGAVLGYLPPKGSLNTFANKKNYKFSVNDEQLIIDWINKNLKVNWVTCNSNLSAIETELILSAKPLLNISKNPYKLEGLSVLRKQCVIIANS